MEQLYAYIPYFAELTEAEAVQWQGGGKGPKGVYTFPYPVYSQKLKDFISDVYKSGLMDLDYMAIIENCNLSMTEVIQLLGTANWDLTRAILTMYIRQERFCDGVWAQAVRDKIFYKLLVRMQEIDSQSNE